VIATGADYRRSQQLKNLTRFGGAGIYYGATFIEAQYCTGEEVIVVGEGNSSGQSAVILTKTTKRFNILIRSACLAKSMSRFLIRRIEETPNILLRPYTEIVELKGDNHHHLQSVRWQNSKTSNIEEHNID